MSASEVVHNYAHKQQIHHQGYARCTPNSENVMVPENLSTFGICFTAGRECHTFWMATVGTCTDTVKKTRLKIALQPPSN